MVWREHLNSQAQTLQTLQEVPLRKFALLAVILAVFAFGSLASAQQGDAYIGAGTLLSPGADPCGVNNGNFACPEKGGTYLNVGADVIFKHRIGAAFDVNWKASQGDYAGAGVPYRPILFDFNAVYQPRINKKAGLDFFGGIGWQSTRFYQYTPTSNCINFGACYSSSNHFLVDLGAGLRYYVWGHMFVRPEVRYYHVTNNEDVFTSPNLIHVGASIGYTIGPD
jgi:Outer membrane protein beta-barrel domain